MRRLDQVVVLICVNMDQLDEHYRAPVAVKEELQLERLTYNGGDIGLYCQMLCPICYDDFKPGLSEVTVMQCSHVFHHSCLSEWLQHSRLCPVCKYETRGSRTDHDPWEQAKVRLRDQKIQNLEDQLRDLIIHIETQRTLDEMPVSVSSELQKGTILPVLIAATSSGSNTTKYSSRNQKRS